MHDLPAHEVLLLLGSDPERGLDEDDARDRLARHGPNTLPHGRGRGWARRLLQQFENPLIHVMLAAAGLALALGKGTDAAVILAVIVLNAAIGFVQETRAERALAALADSATGDATVMRGGRRRRVPAASLVPGDIVLLAAGDRVAADARLLWADGLRVDESSLTGESVPVSKHEIVLSRETEVADRSNVVHSGTMALGGEAAGVVTATGGDTEFGLVHRLLSEAEGVETPLTRRIASMSRVLTVAILALALVTYAAGLAHGGEHGDLLLAAVALAVAAIPEGLPAALTITLAVGVSRMARRRAVVRRLPAVETLGSTTVICTDKTGTLTRNEMTIEEIAAGGVRYRFTGEGYSTAGAILAGGRELDPAGEPALGDALLAGLLCNDATLVADPEGTRVAGDPTEGALLVAAAKAGLDVAGERERLPRRDVVPFRSERALMATVNGGEVWVKGAPERVVALCAETVTRAGATTPLARTAALDIAHALAADGRRVLALAKGSPPDGPLPEALEAGGLTLIGFAAMSDPPRPEAVRSVAECLRAGISVKMVTGDHAATAAGIAKRMGLAQAGERPVAITGHDIDSLDDEQLADAAARASVFARVAPVHKLRLVRALQGRGDVVAMTGDGINDAPALRQADVGVAMGLTGTDVARESADIVLADDDFASIGSAVEEGRHTFDNITKFLVWTLPTNVGEGLLVVAAVAAGTTLPILPAQILWINLITAVGLGLTLAVERAEPGIMRRPPRDPGSPLLARRLVERMLLVGALLLVASFALFEWERASGASLPEARTVAINVFVAIEILYLLQCRTLGPRPSELGPLSNRWLVAGIVCVAGLQMLLTYAPPLTATFDTEPIGLAAWARVAVVAGLAAVLVALERRVRGSGAEGRPELVSKSAPGRAAA